MRRTPVALLATSALIGALVTTGCATTGPGARANAKLIVVAAENVWGSIAKQLGGEQVEVVSLVDNPATDPHDYEPTASDARAVAMARLVIVNGVGYDTWASKLLAANPVNDRQVIDVGKLAGAARGANPHLWYNPSDVHATVEAISAAFAKADPSAAADFSARRTAFEKSDLAAYDSLIASIKAKFAGTPIGVSESVFAMLAQALGLKILTPPSFQRAISEGTDPTAADKATIDRQIKQRKIKVFVYNSQNATPDVRTQVSAAKAAGVPVVTVTETLTPSSATFTEWQIAQLHALIDALEKGTDT
jgi:zinc/manganese transport system substrate-binding protein